MCSSPHLDGASQWDGLWILNNLIIKKNHGRKIDYFHLYIAWCSILEQILSVGDVNSVSRGEAGNCKPHPI